MPHFELHYCGIIKQGLFLPVSICLFFKGSCQESTSAAIIHCEIIHNPEKTLFQFKQNNPAPTYTARLSRTKSSSPSLSHQLQLLVIFRGNFSIAVVV